MTSRENADERSRLGRHWLSHVDTARALNVQRANLSDKLRHYLTHRSASARARGARNVGYVYLRRDVDHALAIRKALGCNTRRALETLSAVRRLEQLGLLAAITEQAALPFEEPPC